METNPKNPVENALDFVTPEVRLSFPSLFTKKPNGPGSDKSSYQATLLIPPGTDISKFTAAMKGALIKKFGKVQVPGLKPMPLRKAEEKEYQGYDPGWLFVATKTESPVPVVDRRRVPITDPSAVYAGCWVRAHVRAWAYDNKFGKGVSFELKAIQFVRDGERLDGRGKPSDPEQVFEALDLDEGTGEASAKPADDVWDPLA